MFQEININISMIIKLNKDIEKDPKENDSFQVLISERQILLTIELENRLNYFQIQSSPFKT